MGKIAVSEKLLAFIENKFQSMLRFEEELEKDRGGSRRELEKKEQREFVRIKRKHGDIERKNPNPFSSVLKQMNAREIAVKGKAKLDFNNFVFMCEYLLERENQNTLNLKIHHRKDVHKWISEFLTGKGYKKGNEKFYSNNDIRRIINLTLGRYSPENYRKTYRNREHFYSIFDTMFKDFCNPKPQGRFKNMTDKEVFDQIHK